MLTVNQSIFGCRYGFLLPRSLSSQEDMLSICVAILHQFGIAPEMYQVGITKLFFRAGQVRPTRQLNFVGLISGLSQYYQIDRWFSAGLFPHYLHNKANRLHFYL